MVEVSPGASGTTPSSRKPLPGPPGDVTLPPYVPHFSADSGRAGGVRRVYVTTVVGGVTFGRPESVVGTGTGVTVGSRRIHCLELTSRRREGSPERFWSYTPHLCEFLFPPSTPPLQCYPWIPGQQSTCSFRSPSMTPLLVRCQSGERHGDEAKRERRRKDESENERREREGGGGEQERERESYFI